MSKFDLGIICTVWVNDQDASGTSEDNHSMGEQRRSLA